MMTDLKGAYALQTPEDSKRLYADWAATYDSSFADAHGYVSPQAVADAFAAKNCPGPVLDIGAGTGLVGVALAHRNIGPIDGTDIAPEMLAEAALKDVYDRLFEGNVLDRLDVDDATYSGIVSAGTFTHGHVGPAAFDELLRVAKPGAWLVLSVNAEHYVADGFDAKLSDIAPKIANVTMPKFRLYTSGSRGPNADDMGLMLQFQKV